MNFGNFNDFNSFAGNGNNSNNMKAFEPFGKSQAAQPIQNKPFVQQQDASKKGANIIQTDNLLDL